MIWEDSLTTVEPFIAKADDLKLNISGFRQTLEQRNRRPQTIASYMQACHFFQEFLIEQGMPKRVADIRREHIEAFIVHQLRRFRPNTAANRYRSLQQFFRWLVDEGEIKAEANPMSRMKPPRVPDDPPPVLSINDLRFMFRTMDKDRSFIGKRDHAIIRILATTGARRLEIADLAYSAEAQHRREDEIRELRAKGYPPPGRPSGYIDLENGVIVVRGKGEKVRLLNLDPTTARVVMRYMRIRSRHRMSGLPWLWLGLSGRSKTQDRGRLTTHGLGQMVGKRAGESGLKGVHPHIFRHTWLHLQSLQGMQDSDLQRLAGWSTPQMLRRYGASAAMERAIEADKRMGIGNLL